MMVQHAEIACCMLLVIELAKKWIKDGHVHLSYLSFHGVKGCWAKKSVPANFWCLGLCK